MAYTKYLKQRTNKDKSVSIYTSVSIPAKTMLMELGGEIVIQDLSQADPSWNQISPNMFLKPSGSITDYLIHSCDPNCFLRVSAKRVFLYSLYIIPVNANLTVDFSVNSSDTPETWQMECKCGSNKCRKIISGYKTLPEDLQTKYQDKGIVPMFIATSLIQETEE